MPVDEPVSAVIPAYNEERHIPSVLDVLCQMEGLAQIIVVDDSSTDGTSDVVRSYSERDPRFHLLCQPINSGKGGAVVAGANASNSDIILFLDADLVGLKVGHVHSLIEPVCAGSCDMAVGLFRQGRWWTDLSHELTPFLSGQRCLRWNLFRSAPALPQARYGIEVALTLHAWRRRYRILPVPWYNVTHVTKYEKLGWIPAWCSYLCMYGEIIRYVGEHFSEDGASRPNKRERKL